MPYFFIFSSILPFLFFFSLLFCFLSHNAYVQESLLVEFKVPYTKGRSQSKPCMLFKLSSTLSHSTFFGPPLLLLPSFTPPPLLLFSSFLICQELNICKVSGLLSQIWFYHSTKWLKYILAK